MVSAFWLKWSPNSKRKTVLRLIFPWHDCMFHIQSSFSCSLLLLPSSVVIEMGRSKRKETHTKSMVTFKEHEANVCLIFIFIFFSWVSLKRFRITGCVLYKMISCDSIIVLFPQTCYIHRRPMERKKQQQQHKSCFFSTFFCCCIVLLAIKDKINTGKIDRLSHDMPMWEHVSFDIWKKKRNATWNPGYIYKTLLIPTTVGISHHEKFAFHLFFRLSINLPCSEKSKNNIRFVMRNCVCVFFYPIMNWANKNEYKTWNV